MRWRRHQMKPLLSSLGPVDMPVDAQWQIRLLRELSSAAPRRGMLK